MWANGDDRSDNGDPVRLYQPILYSGRNSQGTADPTLSHVGGEPSYFENDQVSVEPPICANCGDAMHLLVQLHVPRIDPSTNTSSPDRTLYVFGCNKAACGSALFDRAANKFSVGGGGTFTCRRSQAPADNVPPVGKPTNLQNPTSPVIPSPWAKETGGDGDDENDWNVNDADHDTMEDMEAMVHAMELTGAKGTGGRRTRGQRTKPQGGSTNSTTLSAFSCFEVHALQEPASKKQSDYMDDDDVGTSGGSDDKIQQMLARYMAEEEDEEILNAIRGSSNASGGGGGGKGEKDERLAPEDRAMLAFTDRLKRAPRQVLRYARGGVPMWSIPLPKQEAAPAKGSRRGTSAKCDQPDLLEVPPCPCGATRVFECQLMPSLLHVLEVDKYASSVPANDGTIEDVMSREFTNGGMNWGTIAVYSCPNSCEQSRDEVLIVQESVDGKPMRRAGATDDAMVVDTGDDDDEDEIESMGNQDYDDDSDDDDA